MNNSIVKTIAIAGLLIGFSAHKAQANTNLDFECMKYYESQKIRLDGKFNQQKKVYEYYYQNGVEHYGLRSIATFLSRDSFTYHKSSIEVDEYSQPEIEELCQRPAEDSQQKKNPEPQVKTQELQEIVRQVISEELKKALPPLQPQVKTEELREIIRQLIAEELKTSLPQSQPQTQPEAQTETQTQPSNP
ncbi:hypothetical protein [Calothrix sp. UHCC 0171]|uniref:hypothetical protein n=1 Tax=Calothrix sp. UHCC 0171 TaxID=3110245 RepID=UPI002B1EE04E|nr:hypothetical protein [Calothrix sp. UHCC 0171]MEA5569506.1 hypothetical protein [Calothrix sp. UHCC 0171]